jgi:hypothetical protein
LEQRRIWKYLQSQARTSYSNGTSSTRNDPGRKNRVANKGGSLASIQLEIRDRQEEILWKKKSRFRWLREGENNSKFFH